MHGKTRVQYVRPVCPVRAHISQQDARFYHHPSPPLPLLTSPQHKAEAEANSPPSLPTTREQVKKIKIKIKRGAPLQDAWWASSSPPSSPIPLPPPPRGPIARGLGVTGRGKPAALIARGRAGGLAVGPVGGMGLGARAAAGFFGEAGGWGLGGWESGGGTGRAWYGMGMVRYPSFVGR